MTHFGIHVDDGGEPLPQFVTEQNSKSVELFDWQRRAIAFFMNNNHKVLLEVTTGAGKTFCAIEIMKKIFELHPESRWLVVVPKNVILETGWYKELCQAGFSLADIGVYYGLGKEYGKITITNMQSIHRVALELFDGVIFDEVHNYCTNRLFPFIEYPFSYKIGLSATMERMDNAHWRLWKIFDYNIFRYSPHQAIQEGILNPFNFYNVAVEMELDPYEEYLQLTQELNTILTAGGGFTRIMRTNSGLKFKMLSIMNKRKQLVNNYPRKFDVARVICQKHKGEKTLIFNQFNAQTSKLYWHLLEAGIVSRIMHSEIKKEERDKTLSDFNHNKVDVLATTKILDEGWNVPAVEVAIIMAGDSTAKQTIQRLGRVLRRKNKPSTLYQVYCKGTMEEEQAFERTKLFKELASQHSDYIYKLGEELIINGN